MRNQLCAILVGLMTASCSAVSDLLSGSVPEPLNPETSLMMVQESGGETDSETRDARTVAVNRTFQEGSLQVTLRDVTLHSDRVAIAITIKNVSNQIIRFYPNQGTLSTGVHQLKASMFLSDEQLSGALEPQEEQSGTLVFTASADMNTNLIQIRSIQLSLGQVIDMQSVEPKVFNVAVSLQS